MAFSLGLTSVEVFSESGDMEMNIQIPIPSEKANDELPERLTLDQIPYNEKQLLLAYDVFLSNGTVGYAYTVAKFAVQKNPTSVDWRKKLAQVALWSGRTEVALVQYMYFITNELNANQYIDKAYTLAQQLHDYDAAAAIVHCQLKSQPKNTSLMLRYTEWLQSEGLPKKALKYLQARPELMDSTEDYLKQLVGIAKGLDEPQLTLHYLNKLRVREPKDVKYAMDAAEILYMHRQLPDSFAIYKDFAVKNKPDNVDFWQGFARLATLSGDNDNTIMALKELQRLNALDKSTRLQMVELESFTQRQEAAFKDAQFFYKTTHEFQFIPLAIDLGVNLEKWRDLRSFVEALPSKDVDTIFSGKPDYAVAFTEIYAHTGSMEKAYALWRTILTKWPKEYTVKDSYLWFLVDAHDLQRMGKFIQCFCKLYENKKLAWAPLATALTETGDYAKALDLMLSHGKEIVHSYENLAAIADLFVQNNDWYHAYWAKMRAFDLIMQEINKKEGALSLTTQLRLTELMKGFAPASLIYQSILAMRSKLFVMPEVDNQIVSWTLDNQNYGMASYILKMHERKQVHTPAWMGLTVALAYTDKDLMAGLLAEHPKTLPYRDKVTASVLTGNLKLAEEYAYTGLKDHPKDNQMYELFMDTNLPRSSKVSPGIASKTFGSLTGPLMTATGRFYATPSISIRPYAQVWRVRSTDVINDINNPPNLDEKVGVAVRKTIEKGYVQLSIGERNSLKTNMLGKLSVQQRLTNRTVGTFSLGYHLDASETEAMLIGGMKNNAKWSTTTGWNAHDTTDLQLTVEQFQGQDYSNLGHGQLAEGHWQHKFYLAYPDYNINFYGTITHFTADKGPLSPTLQQLVPVGLRPADIGFYVPISYKELAATIGFGQQYKLAYSHEWKPYLEAGVLYNWPFGFGQIFQGGIGGSIFGRDRLVLYGDYSSNKQQGDQKIYTIGIRYDNYF